jgi:hypothetical protein
MNLVSDEDTESMYLLKSNLRGWVVLNGRETLRRFEK